MIPLTIGKCKIDILPIVSGLSQYADDVSKVYGNYEAYGVSLGIEAIEAVKKREEIGTENVEVSEIDIAYSHKMAEFGDVQVPSPAFCEIVDRCSADEMNVIPLDMNDYDFDTVYLECVKATEFTSVHRLAKKGFKKKFDANTPEELAIEWDAHVSKIKGFGKLNIKREQHIAYEIADVAKYRSSFLAIIEVERVNGIVKLLREEYGAI